MNLKDVVQKLSSARAEFHSTNNSVHGKFVVPPYIQALDLAKIEHSMAIVGGRGCGKTTYVRYFSHWTQYDPQKSNVTEASLSNIIFYWKPDTAYVRSLTKSWLSEENARCFFHSLSGLACLKELISALENIGRHFPALLDQLNKNSLFWNRVKRMLGDGANSIATAGEAIDDAMYDVQVAINSNDTSQIIRIDPKAMFEALLPVLGSGCPLLRNSRYKIFVDEFENLAEYQQKIINGYRKHSDALLNWSVAHKRFAKVSSETDGDENIQQGDDYREYILDEGITGENSEDEKRFFLNELLVSALLNTGLEMKEKRFDLSLLGDPGQLDIRRSKEYRSVISSLVQRILPNPGLRELSRIAIEKTAVKNRVVEKIGGIGGLDVNRLIEDRPDVAISALAISTQRSFNPDDLIDFINSGYKTSHAFNQRVQTYLLSAMLNLNANYSYIVIPVYAGFERFCKLSMFNIRHFFELCYHSLLLMDGKIEIDCLEDFPSLSADVMHQGAVNASNSIVKEVPTYAPMGLTLNGLVNRLGDIFQICQKGDNQSEPEKSHFYILHDFGHMPPKITDIINQAKCWRVLIEFPATKDKNSNSSSGYEYQLNPIYAPYFNISYRKIRRIEFTEKRFLDICVSDSESYEKIRKEYISQSRSSSTTNINSPQGSLFNDFP